MKKIPQIIADAAARYQVNPRLIAAVIYQESKGDAYAFRYEPNFYARHIASKSDAALKGRFSKICSRDTERHSRAISWGLMQVLGQTAREMGFDGDFLTELMDPDSNLEIGVHYLKKQLDSKGLTEGLLAYNGGGNKAYADEVIKHMEGIDIDFLLA